jgi:hypothetical protein
MGSNKSRLCNHQELKIQEVKGLTLRECFDKQTSYIPFFAHIQCSVCHMDSYQVQYSGGILYSRAGWELWTPTSQDQKQPIGIYAMI